MAEVILLTADNGAKVIVTPATPTTVVVGGALRGAPGTPSTVPGPPGADSTVPGPPGPSGLFVGPGTPLDTDLLWVDTDDNTSSTVVETILPGSGIAIDDTDPANPIISSTATGAAWGSITGTLTDQTDLSSALSGKQATITNSDSITQGSTNLFLTGSERTKLTNTSGTNTGDQIVPAEFNPIAGTNMTITGAYPNKTFSSTLATPAGSTGDIQYNNAGAFGGVTVLPVSNGGTGSSTQNWVDLVNPQTIGGSKTFSNDLFASGRIGVSTPILPTFGQFVVTAGASQVALGLYQSSSSAYSFLEAFTYTGASAFRLKQDGELTAGYNGAAIRPYVNGVGSIGVSSGYWQSGFFQTLNLNSTFSISGSTAGLGAITGQLKFPAGSTGSGTALLGSNSPATTNTAPYTWLKMTASDGSQVYVPAWK